MKTYPLENQIDPGRFLEAEVDLAPARCFWNRGQKSTLLWYDKNIPGGFWNPVITHCNTVSYVLAPCGGGCAKIS